MKPHKMRSQHLAWLTHFFVLTMLCSHLWAKPIPEIVAETKPAVIQIFSLDSKGNVLASGTGFFVTDNGCVITNRHVISGASSLVATTNEGATFSLKQVVWISQDSDLALLQFNAHDTKHVTMGNSDNLVEGQRVIVIGNPEGQQGTVSDGIVAAIRSEQQLIQITAPISPGSSGSPVLNEEGLVVGVAVGIWREGQNINFAIPESSVRKMVLSMLAKNQPQQPAAAAVSPAPAPAHESEATSSSGESHLRTQIVLFMENFTRASENSDASVRSQYFAETVAPFYEHSSFTRLEILKSDAEYDRRWPNKSFSTLGVCSVDATSNPNLFNVLQPFYWTVSNGKKTRSGASAFICTVLVKENGYMQIVRINEKRMK